MLTKNLLILAAATMASGALAVNPHRHGREHQHEKKDLKYQTEYTTVTDWVTVTVNGAPSSTSTKFVAAQHSMTRTRTRKYSEVSSSAPPASTQLTNAAPSTSSSTSTSTTSAASSSVAPTTLASSTKKDNVYVAPVPTTPTQAPAPVLPTSSTQPAEEPKPTAAVSSGNKRGLAYNDPTLLAGFMGPGSKIGWTLNWGQIKDNDINAEFVPMLWGPGSNHADTWNTNANKAIAAGSKCLLSFNEPDNAGQANISPQVAAEAHIRLMNPFAKMARIGAPAVTNSGAQGQGLSWLTEFLIACNGKCAIDFVPVHWYSNNGKDFLSHLLRVKNVVGDLPVWVTEFSPVANQIDYNQFLADAMHNIDTNSTFSFVERYSYFMVAEGMLTSGKQPSRLGNTFAYA